MATGLLNANASSVTLECNGVTAMIAKDTGVVAAGAAGVSGNDLVTVGQLGLSKYYESLEQVITSGGLLTLPHGLGAVPKLVTGELVCKTAEQGYSIGQIIGAQIWFYSDSAVDNKGVTFVRDAFNLTGRYGSNAIVFSANHFTTGTGIPLTNTSWRLIVRAWA